MNKVFLTCLVVALALLFAAASVPPEIILPVVVGFAVWAAAAFAFRRLFK